MTKYLTFLPLLIVMLFVGQPTVLASNAEADAATESESPIDIMGTVADHDYFTFLGLNYTFQDFFCGKMPMVQYSFLTTVLLKKPWSLEFSNRSIML